MAKYLRPLLGEPYFLTEPWEFKQWEEMLEHCPEIAAMPAENLAEYRAIWERYRELIQDSGDVFIQMLKRLADEIRQGNDKIRFQYSQIRVSEALIMERQAQEVKQQEAFIQELLEEVENLRTALHVKEAELLASRTDQRDAQQELLLQRAELDYAEQQVLNLQSKCPVPMRDKALFYAEYQCMACEAFPLLQIDRVWPGARGGRYTWDNIQVLCQRCNSEKGDTIREGWDFRTENFRQQCQRELDRLDSQGSLFDE